MNALVLLIIALCVFFGYFVQHSPYAFAFTFSRQQLSLLLPVYGFITKEPDKELPTGEKEEALELDI